MQERESDELGLQQAFAVASGGVIPPASEADDKMLAFFLRKGECTAELTESKFSVRYSWLTRVFPSTYFQYLAPPLIGRLMELGGVERIADEATFQVGPGRTGTGRYVFEFEKKWVRIRREEKRITIRVRDRRKDLDDCDPEFFSEVVRCELCDGVLRTPIAKQCLHCGYDWH